MLGLIYLALPLFISAFMFEMPFWLQKLFVLYTVVAMISCPFVNSIIVDNQENNEK